MAVLRQMNWLGQQRVDVPHARTLESSICADFDLLAGRLLAGRAPLVAQGFNLITSGITQSEDLELQVADSILIHYYASESGSVYQVPADRANETLNRIESTRVSGSFTPSQVNYVGIDLIRSADTSTNDVVMFLDTTTLTTETPREIPLGRTLDYSIVISTSDFSSNANLVPIAKVVTDADNAIVSIEDARNIAWRLGSGGTVPDPLNAFSWPAGRKEGSTGDVFAGGDKALTSFKAWADAVMTRIWETSGGEHWYSPTADRNVLMVRSGTAFVSTGEYFEYVASNLHWRGLKFIFDNSTGAVNEVLDQLTDSVGLTDLDDGECLYVDLDRTQDLTGVDGLQPIKAVLTTLGVGTPNSRYVIAWRSGSLIFTRDQPYPVGGALKVATIGAAGTVVLSASDPTSGSAPKVTTCDSVYGLSISAGVTRGETGGPSEDFFGGAGDLLFGGFANDYNLYLSCSRDSDSVYITGSQNYGSGAQSSLTVRNQNSFITHPTNQILKATGFNSTSGVQETAVVLYSSGAIGLRNVYNNTTPSTPAPTAAEPVRSNIFVRTNGLVSPATRDQVCVLWIDGSVTVLAEGPEY